MRPHHDVMTSERVYRHAANRLQPQLQWVDHGRQCTVKALLLLLFYAAGQLCSLAMACQRLRTAPSDQAVQDALRALCPPSGDPRTAVQQELRGPIAQGVTPAPPAPSD